MSKEIEQEINSNELERITKINKSLENIKNNKHVKNSEIILKTSYLPVFRDPAPELHGRHRRAVRRPGEYLFAFWRRHHRAAVGR